MSRRQGWIRSGVLGVVGSSLLPLSAAWAEAPLFVAYPPPNHETTSDRIFVVGTSDPSQDVWLNGVPIRDRSPSGHFAPSIPLNLGENIITLTQGTEQLTLQIIRQPALPPIDSDLGFVPESLLPQVNLTRQVGETVCFGVQAIAEAQVKVSWGGQTLTLSPHGTAITLPPNAAVLIQENAPIPLAATVYEGCTKVPATGTLGQPSYQIATQAGITTQLAPGSIERIATPPFQIATVTAASGTARTGPSTDYSRLTPLPTGTRTEVTGTEGDWLRLDYGGWIRAAETQITTAAAPPRSLIRSISSREIPGWTEVRFPLQTPVPISLEQTATTLTLTLHNTTAQTDTVYLSANPLLHRLDWQPQPPDKTQYRFQFKTQQQWGYRVRYEGTTLVLALRHPPQLQGNSLAGSTILLDPGHGSEHDLGARGPTGYPEKDVTLAVSQQLRAALEQRGAKVVMTREGDEDLYPSDRAARIEAVEPTLALSLHYNALPDAGDALNTAGISTFWYNPQAHSLAQFLHDYLVSELGRPSYGVYWNNLALTRPTVAPSVLIELGFMTNPTEFEWIIDPEAQTELVEALADAIALWMQERTAESPSP